MFFKFKLVWYQKHFQSSFSILSLDQCLYSIIEQTRPWCLKRLLLIHTYKNLPSWCISSWNFVHRIVYFTSKFKVLLKISMKTVMEGTLEFLILLCSMYICDTSIDTTPQNTRCAKFQLIVRLLLLLQLLLSKPMSFYGGNISPLFRTDLKFVASVRNVFKKNKLNICYA